jgi:hypothetical protein
MTEGIAFTEPHPLGRFDPLPLRLALFYAAFFPTLGIYIPFLPSYLAGKGMAAEEIGYLLGAIQISRLIGNPLIARGRGAPAADPAVVREPAGLRPLPRHPGFWRAAPAVPGPGSGLHRRGAADRQPRGIGGRGWRF